MRHITTYLLSILILCTCFSCVTNSKYRDLQANAIQAEYERDSLRNTLASSRYTELELERVKNEIQKKEADKEMTMAKLTALEASYDDLLKRYDDIIFQNQSLLANSSQEMQLLTEQLSKKQTELDQEERSLQQMENRLNQMESRLNLKERELADLGLTLKETKENSVSQDVIKNCEQRLNQLNTLLQTKEASLAQLRSRINQALLGLSASDLSVSEANGRIYVTLSQNLLFKSGSDQIDWKGKQALIKLANVLRQNNDININVEGHTDSDGTAAQNWDLSTRRATNVVKILTTNGVDPKRVIASGRAFYLPVASNGTTAGKARNRRTEIILEPKLDELYELINQ